MNGEQGLIYHQDFWKNPQNWIYIGVAAIAVIGFVAILLNYNRPKTEAEIRADVLNALRQSEAAPIAPEDRAKVLQSLRASQVPVVSDAEKARVLEALRGGTSAQ
ncbi:MAG: hypothetical protein HYS44_02485 [Candidatus Niyogibacteria bacterium]|nr:hypothetical protein [Candidatus Niyogibacteria bacterium]